MLICAGVAASLLAIGGGVTMGQSLTFPSDLAQHPVSGTAVVVDSFINGFGGDPAVDYSYNVDGHSYRGWGENVPGSHDLLSVKPGTVIPIQYAADHPDQSCTCDAANESHGWSGAIPGALAIVPLLAVLPVLLRRRWRRQWLGAERSTAAPAPISP